LPIRDPPGDLAVLEVVTVSGLSGDGDAVLVLRRFGELQLVAAGVVLDGKGVEGVGSFLVGLVGL